MKPNALKAWLWYAAAAVAVTVLVGLVAVLLADRRADRAIMVGGSLGLAIQLAAFGMLLAVRDQAHLFLVGWLGGMLLRFGVLGVCMYWGSRTEVLPLAPLLLSLVGFVFVLLMLEPVFLRWDLRKS